MTDRPHLKLVTIENDECAKAAAMLESGTVISPSTEYCAAIERDDEDDTDQGAVEQVDQVANDVTDEKYQSANLVEIRLPKTGYSLYTDHNGVVTHHLADLPDADVEGVSYPPGHIYAIEHGASNTLILFQNGPVKEVGVNGATNENVIACLIDRLCHLNHAFPCEENVQAIGFLSAAMGVLEKRTKDRIARQVEGENKV